MKTTAAGMALAGIERALGAQTRPDGSSGTSGAESKTLPTITLGRTGRSVPRLGFGGHPISTLQTDEQAVEVLRRAFACGVRYIDTAPSYGNGESERRIGLALADTSIPRSEFFIATKTLRRDGDGAQRELEESLKRLGLQYIDSVQCHEVHDDVAELFAPNAALAALEKAREEKLIRHVGVTGHRNPRWLIDAVNRHPFDTALVPVNPLDKQHLSFINEFLPVAVERQVAVIAMKVYAGGHLVQPGRLSAGDCLSYALSQRGVAVVVPGCQTVAHVDQACETVCSFQPLSSEAQQELEQRAGRHKGRESEWYKDEPSDHH